ncbi:MAG: hypothetical protein JNN27_13215 [Planctomycetes bacterium]|nr:hypothetical protein [Planctomycetota bacterium]
MQDASRSKDASWSLQTPATDGWYWIRCRELLGTRVRPARIEHVVTCDVDAAINVEVDDWVGDYQDLPPGVYWWTDPILPGLEDRWTNTPPTKSGLYFYRSSEHPTWQPFTIADVTCIVDEDGYARDEATIREHGPGGAESTGDLDEWPGEWWPVAISPPRARLSR